MIRIKSLQEYFGLLILYFLLQPFSAQDITYARKVIDTLASPFMHGRGYVENGDRIAANYLAREFENLKLNYFRKNYYQNFRIDVNTFPETPFIFVDGKKLLPGKEFILSCSSGSAIGVFPLSFINRTSSHKSDLNENLNCVIVAEQGENNISGKTKAYIVKQNRLTHSVCGTVRPEPILYILDSLVPTSSKKVQIDIRTKLVRNYKTQNIIGYIIGSLYPDSFIVFSAHYDHLGQLGKEVYFPGANDNASGCAMMLNLTKYYSQHPPKYSIAFMAFGAEEAGLLGSKYYVEHPLFPLKQIKFLLNFDMLGTGDDGLTVVNGSVFNTEFNELVQINESKKYLPEIKSRGKARNSDHYYFSENGVKCFFIYTLGGIKAYHDIYDRPETLPLTKFEDVCRLLIDFTTYLQK